MEKTIQSYREYPLYDPALDNLILSMIDYDLTDDQIIEWIEDNQIDELMFALPICGAKVDYLKFTNTPQMFKYLYLKLTEKYILDFSEMSEVFKHSTSFNDVDIYDMIFQQMSTTELHIVLRYAVMNRNQIIIDNLKLKNIRLNKVDIEELISMYNADSYYDGITAVRITDSLELPIRDVNITLYYAGKIEERWEQELVTIEAKRRLLRTYNDIIEHYKTSINNIYRDMYISYNAPDDIKDSIDSIYELLVNKFTAVIVSIYRIIRQSASDEAYAIRTINTIISTMINEEQLYRNMIRYNKSLL